MNETGAVRYGNTDIPYQVSRSTRRKKTIEITFDPVEGVLVAAPMNATAEQIEVVLRKRASWIVQRSIDGIELAPPKTFLTGETLPYMGREVRMEVTESDVRGVRIRFSPWAFKVLVPVGASGVERVHTIRAAFLRWYRRRATERVTKAVARWSSLTGTEPHAVKIRDQRQRWGSCAPDGTLRFNWRIAMADSWLLDYVVVHELCHLRLRNHSKEFWTAVETVMPDFRLRRMKLKEVGPQLVL